MIGNPARRAVALAIAAILVLTLGGTARAAPVIKGTGSVWSPSTVTVQRGSVVKWKGVILLHDVKAYGGNWSFKKPLPVGAVVKRRFRSTGTFLFRCTLHSELESSGVCTGMCGRVIVRA
jgi:plastocyanin